MKVYTDYYHVLGKNMLCWKQVNSTSQAERVKVRLLVLVRYAAELLLILFGF